jgi:cholera toxin transcriptional activator
MSSGERKIFRFGVFEADTDSRELRKAGMRLKLQEQPFQVLLLLLERPGEVVTREEIRQKLWPSDTFVDFDHSLNTIINKIREALNDAAANPRFVETLAKRGYRFVSAVDSSGRPDVKTNLEPDRRRKDLPETASRQRTPSSTFQLTQMEELPAAQPAYVRGLFLLIQAMYLIFILLLCGECQQYRIWLSECPTDTHGQRWWSLYRRAWAFRCVCICSLPLPST